MSRWLYTSNWIMVGSTGSFRVLAPCECFTFSWFLKCDACACQCVMCSIIWACWVSIKRSFPTSRQTTQLGVITQFMRTATACNGRLYARHIIACAHHSNTRKYSNCGNRLPLRMQNVMHMANIENIYRVRLLNSLCGRIERNRCNQIGKFLSFSSAVAFL